MQILTAEAIETVCRDNPGWTFETGELVRELGFPDFLTAIAFIDRLALIAEKAGHHPDIDIRYNRVRLALTTHDAGGITTKDSAMVAAVRSILLS